MVDAVFAQIFNICVLVRVSNGELTVYTYCMVVLLTKITNSRFCLWKCFKFDAYMQLDRHLYNEHCLSQGKWWT